MKIGIITTFKANNYGAELQAYATQQKLRNMGYDAELIDYLFYKNRKHKYTKDDRPWRRFPLKEIIRHYVLYRIVNPILDILGNALSRSMKMRTRNFLEFHENNSKMSKTYYSMQELYNAEMDYNVYCVGSDQVWNPATASSLEPHFLSFAPKDKLKFSYASSFGVSDLEEEIKPKYKDGLANLDYISCRECQGVELVKLLTGRDAMHVLDPTLLLNGDEWRTVAQYSMCPEKGKYILLYNIIELDEIYQLARKISRETGYPIIKLCKRGLLLKEYEGVRNIPTAGPADFLGLIDNAYMLITNSFHGFVFAINLNTPVWVMIDENAKNNSRLESIMNLLGFNKRLLNTKYDINGMDFKEDLDFENAHKILDNEREKSIDYLRMVLDNK